MVVEEGFHNNLFMNTPRRLFGSERVTISVTNLFGHASFVLLAVSYLEEDVLRLRYTAVASIACSIVFQYFRPFPLFLPISWNASYILLNVGMILNLLRERSLGDDLSEQEKRTFAQVFEPAGLTPALFGRLLAAGHRVDAAMGNELTSQGTAPRKVMLIAEGLVEVMRDHADGTEEHLAYLGPGSFVGEIAFLQALTPSHAGEEAGEETDGRHRPATATCTAALRTELYAWDYDVLLALLHKERQLSNAVQSAMTADVSRKLSAASNDSNPDRINRYYTLLEGALINRRIVDRERSTLRAYRERYHITEEMHRWALARHGWTEEDYARGRKSVSASSVVLGSGSEPRSEEEEEEEEA